MKKNENRGPFDFLLTDNTLSSSKENDPFSLGSELGSLSKILEDIESSASLTGVGLKRKSLSDLVADAKGDRSMRGFSESSGVNVSTISRLINGKITDVSVETLEKIAADADPASGVTLDQLKASQEIADQGNAQLLASQFDYDCRSAITNGLLDRGYSVRYPRTPATSNTFYNFEIVTDALGHDNRSWFFECKTMASPARQTDVTISWIHQAMVYYYCGGTAGRISLVVDSAAVYEQIKNRLSEYKIPDEISVILISGRTGRVQKEYVTPLIDDRSANVIFKERG